MVYNYTTFLPFEKDFDLEPKLAWMKVKWWYSIVLSILYVVMIKLGQQWMDPKKPFHLDKLLTLWNSLLSALSITAFIRETPSFYSMLSRGFTDSICIEPPYNSVAAFWAFILPVSKVLEFGDTLFIVLRKKPLAFLHYYHHFTVLIFTWYTFKDRAVTGLWFGWINYLVHSCMYTYYTVRSLGIRPPRRVAMIVTTLQTLQMLMAVVISVSAFVLKKQGVPCQQSYQYLYFSFAIYLSYFILFAKLFYGLYFGGGGEGKIHKISKIQ